MVEIMEYAGDLLTHLHVADSFDHTGVVRPALHRQPARHRPARVHQHLDIGQGEVDWDGSSRRWTSSASATATATS